MKLKHRSLIVSVFMVIFIGLGSVVSLPETARAQTGDPVFVGAGDITDCSRTTDEATAQLLDGIAGTVFTLGDNAYPNGTLNEFNNCYGPGWGRHKNRTRPSPGNHDYHPPGASGYYTYFGAAASPLDANCTRDCKGYYSYNLGAWHIIVLNSESTHKAGSAQEQWLRADLAANQSMCTLAYWHRALFSSGIHGNIFGAQPLWQALYDYGADVIVNAHDHLYERFAPQNPGGQADAARGIREFIVGTGGSLLYPFSTIQPNSEVRNNTTWGVLKLTLHATSYDWQFIPIAGQTFTDSGSSNCVSATATLPPPAAASLISPSGAVTDTTPAYAWNKVNTATWYYLWVSRVNSDGSLTTVHNKWYDSSAICSGASCSFTPAVTLSIGQYRWWVQTWGDGGYGPWSSDLNFGVGAPGVATLVSPSGATTGTTPAYTWNKVNTATWYYLWVSRVNDDSSLTTIHTKWYDASAICNTTCSITPDITLSGGNYKWWIQAWNEGGYGPWTSPTNFSLPVVPAPGAATLVSPSGVTANTTPAYTWSNVNAATWYYLWVSKVNDDGTLTTVHSQWYDAAAVCSGATCSITPVGVTLSGGNYQWWIQTWNDGGYGPWTSPTNFTVSP